MRFKIGDTIVHKNYLLDVTHTKWQIQKIARYGFIFNFKIQTESFLQTQEEHDYYEFNDFFNKFPERFL